MVSRDYDRVRAVPHSKELPGLKEFAEAGQALAVILADQSFPGFSDVAAAGKDLSRWIGGRYLRRTLPADAPGRLTSRATALRYSPRPGSYEPGGLAPLGGAEDPGGTGARRPESRYPSQRDSAGSDTSWLARHTQWPLARSRVQVGEPSPSWQPYQAGSRSGSRLTTPEGVPLSTAVSRTLPPAGRGRVHQAFSGLGTASSSCEHCSALR
ncbi:hypothetical protein JBE27_10590, partial [Streptomyces albiflaviniger]|nr:hypothetical protein [Streptomyces albiflaviniger]